MRAGVQDENMGPSSVLFPHLLLFLSRFSFLSVIQLGLECVVVPYLFTSFYRMLVHRLFGLYFVVLKNMSSSSSFTGSGNGRLVHPGRQKIDLTTIRNWDDTSYLNQ